MMRALCKHCAREARYAVADYSGVHVTPGIPGVRLCARHAQAVAHAGYPLDTVGVCGHRAPVADMVARRPCPDCRAPITLSERPTRWDDDTGARVRLSDEELRRAGWTRNPDGTFTR